MPDWKIYIWPRQYDGAAILRAAIVFGLLRNHILPW